jgi:hypothetical protein
LTLFVAEALNVEQLHGDGPLGRGWLLLGCSSENGELSVRVGNRYSGHVTGRVMLLQRLCLWIFCAAEACGAGGRRDEVLNGDWNGYGSD